LEDYDFDDDFDFITHDVTGTVSWFPVGSIIKCLNAKVFPI